MDFTLQYVPEVGEIIHLSVAILILVDFTLQYMLLQAAWDYGMEVAILILVDFTLQYVEVVWDYRGSLCRNPYFSGLYLAIKKLRKWKEMKIESQSLF